MLNKDQNNTTQGSNQQQQQPRDTGMGGNTMSNAMGNAGIERPQRNSTLASMMGRGRSNLMIVKQSDTLLKLQGRMEAILKELESDYAYKLIPMDMQIDNSLSISVLVWCQWVKTNTRKVVYRAMPLAASLGTLGNITEQFGNNMSMEVLRVPSSAMDERMVGIIAKTVADTFPSAQVKDCDYCMIRSDFPLEKPEEGSALTDYVYMLAAYFDNDLSNVLDMGTEYYRDLDLTLVNDASLQVRPTFEIGRDILDATRTPLRASVVVSLSSVQGGQGNQAVREVTLTETSGFLDLAWFGRPQNEAYNNGMNQNNQPFLPHFVITDINVGNSQTPETYLLALPTVGVMRRNHAFLQGFRSRDRSKVSYHDIGSMSVFANPYNEASGFGNIEDTRAENFNQEKYLQSMIRPELIVSLDIPVGRTLSTITTLISDAASGIDGARKMLLAAANRLTGGKFSALCAERGISTDLFLDSGIVLPEGCYIDENGQERDLRNLDVIAMCNLLGNKDNNKLVEYMSCLQQSNVNTSERLARMRRIYVGILGESNVKFTGVVRRININAQALAALGDSIGQATGGTGFRAVLPTFDQTTNTLSGLSGIERMMLGNGNQGAGLFNMNGGNNGGNGRGIGLGINVNAGRWN